LSKQPQKLFLNIKSSNHFCTHHLFVWFTVHPGACRPSSVRSRASCVPRMRVLGLESTAMPVHFALALCVSASGNCTCTCTAVRLLRLSHRQCSRVVDHTDEIFVRSLSGLSCYQRASSRHRGLPSFLVLCATFRFFDVGSFCAARGNFPRLRRLPARQWSYHCTGRSSSTYWAMRGIIFIHFAGGHPFPLQSSLPCDVSRLALIWRREKLSSGPVHAPMPPALPHAHSRRRISWNFDTPIAFEAHKLMIAKIFSSDRSAMCGVLCN